MCLAKNCFQQFENVLLLFGHLWRVFLLHRIFSCSSISNLWMTYFSYSLSTTFSNKTSMTPWPMFDVLQVFSLHSEFPHMALTSPPCKCLLTNLLAASAGISLPCLLVHHQHLAQCWASSRCLVNIYWIHTKEITWIQIFLLTINYCLLISNNS